MAVNTIVSGISRNYPSTSGLQLCRPSCQESELWESHLVSLTPIGVDYIVIFFLSCKLIGRWAVSQFENEPDTRTF